MNRKVVVLLIAGYIFLLAAALCTGNPPKVFGEENLANADIVIVFSPEAIHVEVGSTKAIDVLGLHVGDAKSVAFQVMRTTAEGMVECIYEEPVLLLDADGLRVLKVIRVTGIREGMVMMTIVNVRVDDVPVLLEKQAYIQVIVTPPLPRNNFPEEQPTNLIAGNGAIGRDE